jgi:hypothetical protein
MEARISEAMEIACTETRKLSDRARGHVDSSEKSQNREIFVSVALTYVNISILMRMVIRQNAGVFGRVNVTAVNI